MASQRRAPTKRPPRPAAKKPPPPIRAGCGRARQQRIAAAGTTAVQSRKTTASPRPPAGGPSGPPTQARPAPSRCRQDQLRRPRRAQAQPVGPDLPAADGGTRSASPPSPAAAAQEAPKVTKRPSAPWSPWPLVASLVIFFALAVNGSSINTPTINAALVGPRTGRGSQGPALAAVDTRPLPGRRSTGSSARPASRWCTTSTPTWRSSSTGSPASPLRHRDRPAAAVTTPATAPSSTGARASTGCTPTPRTGSCTSSRRPRRPTTWASSSTCGASRSRPARSARPSARSRSSWTARRTPATPGHPARGQFPDPAGRRHARPGADDHQLPLGSVAEP